MKRNFLLPTGFCLSLLSGPESLGALNTEIVPAESQWVLNLDFNSLRSSALGGQMLEMMPEIELTPESDPIRADYRNILETIGTVTAFGTSLSTEPTAIDGALIAEGTKELRKIVEGFVVQALVSHPDQFSELTDLPFEAYSGQGGVIIAFPPEPIIVVTKSRDQLMKALAVYRREAPSMATTNSRLTALLPQEGEFFLSAASIVPSTGDLSSGNRPEARILRMASAASIALGERGELTTAHVQLDADSNDTARKLVKIVDGVIAIFSLAETDDNRLRDFIDSADVRRDDRTVKIDLAYPTVRIVEMVETIRHPPYAAQGTGGSEKLEPPGRVLAIWAADQHLADDAVAPGNFVTRTIENVDLQTGATIVLSGRRDSGENVRYDYIELTPSDGTREPTRFEAEFMRLSGYHIENVPHASGGEVIHIGDEGDGRMRFMGPPGSYTLDIRYVDETDGAATFGVSIIDPETPSPNL